MAGRKQLSLEGVQTMASRIPTAAELESLSRSALDLHAQANRLRIGAVARLHRCSDAAIDTPVDLRTAQNCVANEWGYDDWATMNRRLTEPPSDPLEAAHWLVSLILDDNTEHVDFDSPMIGEITAEFLAVRLAMLDPSVSIDQLVNQGVDDTLPPFDVPALVYVCCSKYGATNTTLRTLRREWTDQLLQNNADPNAGMRERDTIRGFRTCLGGAIGFARDVELARQLLDAGADINDGPTLYEGSAMWEAVRLRDHAALTVLIDAEPPEWHLCHALTHCMQFHDAQIIEKLLVSGADPNWNMTVFGLRGNALHEAVQCEAPISTIELLLDHGAKLDATDNGDRTPLAIAVARGREDIVTALEKRGAERSEAGDIERFVGACFRTSKAEAAEIRTRTGIKGVESYHDQLWLHEAINSGSHEVLNLLLTVDFEPDTIDYQGETALHRAVLAADEHALEVLLDLGASTSDKNFNGDTVVELALRSASQTNSHVIDVLARSLTQEQFNAQGSRLRPQDVESFELAADSIANGNMQQLKDLLGAHPYFRTARSVRPHHCALMNYIGVNGFEGERQKSPDNAVEIIETLLDAGCDPDVLCYTYRGGPGENTLGLLLSSGVVESPKQQMAMTRALVSGGATIGEEYLLLFSLLDAKESDSVVEVVSSIDISSAAARDVFFALAGNRELSLMGALLDVGLDVNVTNDLKQTALHWAAFNGDETVVDWLLERGADPTLKELQFNGTSAGWADAGEHPDLAKRLANLD